MESDTATAAQPEYLTVAEVSHRFRVSVSVSVPTIYRRCADGQLPHIRIGSDGPIRIPTSQLERLRGQGVSDDGPPAGAASPAQTPLSARGPKPCAGSRTRRRAGPEPPRTLGCGLAPRCVRRQQEANRQAAEAQAREDEKRRLRPPPIGLRVTN